MILFSVQRRFAPGVPLGNGRVARLSYQCVEIFWFSLANQFTWEIVGRDPADDVTTTRQAIEDESGVRLSEPGWWTRYSLLLALCVVVAIALVVSR